jgi:dTMP kinase
MIIWNICNIGDLIVNSENKRPFFIVVDGLDGSGKTTICNYIAEKTKASYMRAFGQGPIGKTIREHFLKETNNYNKDVEFNWVLSANLETVYDYVIPALSQGQSIVLDRFLSATYAYQIARLDNQQFGTIKPLDAKQIYFENILRRVLEDAPVSLYIYCDVNIENSSKRISSRTDQSNHYDMESKALKLQTLIGYETFFKETTIESKYKIDCNKPLDIVLKKVDEILNLFKYY